MEGRNGTPPETTSRRFPPPWTIEEHNQACFIVKDATSHAALMKNVSLFFQIPNNVGNWRVPYMGPILSSVLGFVGGIFAWFATNYWGRTLLRFWDLRLEAHETMYLYANVRPVDLTRLQEGSAHLRKLGAKIDGLGVVLPSALSWYLRVRRYDLRLAAQGLTGLSNSLGASDEVRFRVQVQRNLRLPVASEEREKVEREQRLDGVPL
jgi:hypothetical protein